MVISWHIPPAPARLTDRQKVIFFSAHGDKTLRKTCTAGIKTFELTPPFHTRESLSLQKYQKCLATLGMPNYGIKLV